MSGRFVKVLLSLAILFLSEDAFMVDALHEDVVDGILTKVSLDFKKVDTQPEEISFSVRKRLGQMDTTVSADLITGRLVLLDLTRDGDVTYAEDGDDSPARFEFAAQLKTFFAYRYRFSVAGTKWSFGNVVGNWSSSVNVQLDLGPDDCALTLVKAQRSTATFDVGIEPFDNFFYPATLHLSAGNSLEKHLDRHVKNVIQTTFKGQKICDCINC